MRSISGNTLVLVFIWGIANVSSGSYALASFSQACPRGSSEQVGGRVGTAPVVSGATLTFNYDAVKGQLNSITTPGGNFTYTYLPRERPDYAKAPNGNFNILGYQGDFVNSESYYVNGGATYLGRVTSVINSDFRVGSVDVVGAVGGTETYTMTYDNDGLLTQAGSLVITRNATTGFVSSTTLSTIGTTSTYDPTYGEVATFDATYTPSGGSASTLFSQSYTRDSLGRVATKTETIGGVTSTYVYNYNTAGALTDVTKNGVPFATYGYDTNLNRTSATVGGISVAATYDNQDRLSTYGTYTFTHNAPGEWLTRVNSSPVETWTFGYDSIGNLTSVQRPAPAALITYEADPFNRRVRKKIGTTVVKQWTYYDQLRIAAEFGASSLISRFVYGTRSNVPDYMVSGGVTYRIISDHLGSVRLVVNAATGAIAQQIDYDEFGRVISDTSPGFQPFGFAGGLYDPDTKLVRFGARDYDPETGRWTAKDPILFAGGDTNLYGYVLNDPVNWNDPTGNGPVAGSVCYALIKGGSSTLPGLAYESFDEKPEPRATCNEGNLDSTTSGGFTRKVKSVLKFLAPPAVRYGIDRYGPPACLSLLLNPAMP